MELFPGDMLLTASDGLTDLALAKDILGATRQALASGGLDHAAEQLVRMANDRGGHDNITVQLVKVTATGARKTRSGSTQTGSISTTLSDGQGPPQAGQQHHQQQSQAHGVENAGPTSVDAQRPRAETIPMQPAATAHDGTSRSSHAAGLPQAHAQHGNAPGHGLPLPPMGGAVSPTLAQSLESQPVAGLSGYRLDMAGALPLPPASARFGMNQPGYGQPGAQQAVPQAMQSAPGYGQPGGAWVPNAPGSFAGMGPGQGSGIDSAAGRTGGSVLFLALAISFVVAVVALALLWLLVLR